MNREQLPAARLSLPVGRVVGKAETTVIFSEAELAEHMAVFGGTGKGKSKFLELIVRKMIDQKAGVCVIDPHGDLVEDLLAFVLQNYKDATGSEVTKRFHYFDPGSPTWRFSFDPFRYQPRPDGHDDYEDWLKAKVESVARIIIRKQGEVDFAGKPRLERFLSNVLYACGVRVNDRGDHLSLADAFVLLDPSHPQHDEVYQIIAPGLLPEVRSDFNKVRRSNPRQQEEWVESTINRLRSFLSPAVKSIFANKAASPVDFAELLASGGIMLVNLRRTRSFTIDQANAIGGLFINEIISAAQTANRAERRPFYLFIDEASRFIGQDLIDALAQCRKWKLSLCLAVQDLSSLQHQEIDMVPKVLSQCGIHVSFQQKHPDDIELLSQLFGLARLDFTPLVHEVDRFAGYKYETLEDTSESVDSRRSRQDASSDSRQSGTSKKRDYPHDIKDQESAASSKSKSMTEAEGHSSSVTRKTVPLAQHRSEIQETGQLRHSVQDQFHALKSALRTLGRGEAVVCLGNDAPFLLKVENVRASFGTLPEAKRLELIDGYKKLLAQSHPYCFRPGDNEGEKSRLQEFFSASRPAEDATTPENSKETATTPNPFPS